jgi:hypothetical protein
MMPAVANKRTANLDGPDFYPTPAWATNALLSVEKFSGSINEPCCGAGAMSVELSNAGYEVISSDMFNHGFGKSGIDARRLIGPVDNIVTNPPYNIAAEMLEHFLGIYRRKIALLLRLSFLESRKRYPLFQRSPPSRIHIFSERLSLCKAGGTVNGGGTISYAWLVWMRKRANGPVVHWLPPIWKKDAAGPIEVERLITGRSGGSRGASLKGTGASGHVPMVQHMSAKHLPDAAK